MSDDPTPLSVALAELIARKGLARVQTTSQFADVWKQIAGEKFAKMTRVLSFRGGVFEIGVSNSAVLNELVSFHRQSLLKKLQTDFPQHNVRDLRFKLKSETAK